MRPTGRSTTMGSARCRRPGRPGRPSGRRCRRVREISHERGAMSGQLSQRTAIVTGAADGIGRGIARCFAQAGARLLVADIDAEANDACAQQLRDEFGADVHALRVDVSHKPDVLTMVATAADTWGRV